MPKTPARPDARVSPVRATRKERDALAAEVALFEGFYPAYSDLVELICDAAQCGLCDDFSSRYEALRARFAASLARSPFLLSADFDALHSCATLEELLSSDGGVLRERLARTGEAVEHWIADLQERLSLAGFLDD